MAEWRPETNVRRNIEAKEKKVRRQECMTVKMKKLKTVVGGRERHETRRRCSIHMELTFIRII